MATTSETTQDDSPMHLRVSNFGPIAEAEIELRPLTVFVGPSNTGKSYLAILLYALHRIFSGSFQDIHAQLNGSPSKRRAYSSPFHSSRMLDRKITKTNRNTIIGWASEFSNDNIKNNELYEILSSAIALNVRSELNAGKYPEEEIFSEIVRCFGVSDMSEIIRHSTKSASISVTKKTNKSEEPFEFKLHVSRTSKTFEAILPDENQLQLNKDKDFNWQQTAREIALYVELYDPNSDNFAASRILDSIVDNVFAGIVNPLHLSSYYFPASRTGIVEASHAIKAALYSRISRAGIEPIRVPLISGIIADFLSKMDPDFLLKNRTTKLSNYADKIEKTVLEGKVLIENSEYGDTPSFFFQENSTGRSIPLIIASSMVTEVAPIILYLRYLVHESNILIIEEPEAHLHPTKQVEFTRQLASLIQKGVRIIITTHSEWILEALGNIVQVSKLPEEERNGLPSEDFALERDQVGVWLFKSKKRPKGSVVKEIEIDGDSGNFPVDYSEVMEALYDEWVSTFNRLENMRVT